MQSETNPLEGGPPLEGGGDPLMSGFPGLMWLYPKPGVLDTATRLMTAQSKGCTAMLLGQDSKYSLTE